MRLKRLQLQGYKTFANKTEFIFDEGITAIVGPNGCGKSNVADAVRWVLGEQSFSELRGKRTTDMIFSGSTSRPRAGMASAVLTLDNSNGWLPIDFSEVEINRRAYRSGDNEYYLNGQRVRLKDIRELLATSGLAQRTYTMIGQGLVDRALSLKSDERRALFEEAAGISHYKARRAETLRRLRETQRNIERVNDVLAEIKPRLNSLKRQASRAQNYEVVQNDLRHLLRIWYGYQWEQGRKTLRVVREKSAESEKAWKESRRKLIYFQEQIDDSRRKLNRYSAQLTEKETQREGMREQLEAAKRQVAILMERQALVARQLKEIEAELPELETQQTTAQTDLNQATEELATVQSSLDADRSVLAKFEATFKAQQSEIDRWQKTVQTLERTTQNGERDISQAEGQLSQLRERLAEQQASEVDTSEIESASAKLATFATQIETLQAESKAIRTERNKLIDQRSGLIRTLKKMRRDLMDKNRAATGLNKEVAKLEARADLLNSMRTKKTKVKGNAEIIGRFASKITISAEHQTAIEAALQSRLGALLVPDEANLWQLLTSNKKDNIVALSLANLHPPKPAKLPKGNGVLGWASDLVTFQPEDGDLVALLLGQVLLVESNESAFTVAQSLSAGSVAVSSGGLVCHAGGLVERRSVNARDSILAQEKEWRSAKAAVKKQQTKVADAQAELDGLQKEVDAKQAEIDKLGIEEGDFGRKEQQKVQALNQTQRDHDRLKQQIGFIERQQANRDKDLVRLKDRIADLEKSVASKNDVVAKAKAELGGARVKLQALPIAEARQQRTAQQQKIAATSTIVDGRRAVVDSRRATLGQIENRLMRQRQRLHSLKAQGEQINLQDEQQKLYELQKRMDAIANDIEPLRSLRTKVQGELSDVEADLSVFQKEAHKLENAYTEARLNLSQSENQVTGLRERIKADLGLVDLSHDDDETVQIPLQMKEVVEKLPEVDELPDGIDLSIQKRRSQLQRMGAINPDAPEEYETTKERFEFLTQQIEDLDQTEQQLRKVIDELDDLTSKEFAKTVEQVNGIFGDMFTRLFGGGSAELVLTDPDNLTITGVDIVARLPRRRAQGLGLLSGGERSLTAAALIFSLLKVTPPPFCVMDEVDAALDEANINRFRDALRELSINTQFIVITHNRGTVQASNTIYGISMGGDSASQVISIKPEDYFSTEDVS